MAEADGEASEFAVSNPLPTTTQNRSPAQPGTTSLNPAYPAASLADNGQSKRPRDSRLIHMILANLGVSAYQERVPLQLMDFAYRYTSSTLQDALHLTSEGYGTSGIAGGAGRGAGAGAGSNNNDVSSVTLASLRLSIASRTHYQFNPTLPKEFYHEIAQERNRVALPMVGRDWGVRLPPDQYCLTGVGWSLKEEWDSEGEANGEGNKDGDEGMMDEGTDQEGEGDGGEDGNERMEDIFGDQMDDGEEDREMEDK